jgi:cytochrome c
MIYRIAFLLSCLATTATAGDAAKGDGEFKKCLACHAIIATDGTEIRKGGKTGPNLYGVIGRQVGAYPEFPYGDAIVAVGASGTVWDEASLAEYVANPALWLQTALEDKSAKSKMAFKLAKGGADVAAYLASVAP